MSPDTAEVRTALIVELAGAGQQQQQQLEWELQQQELLQQLGRARLGLLPSAFETARWLLCCRSAVALFMGLHNACALLDSVLERQEYTTV